MPSHHLYSWKGGDSKSLTCQPTVRGSLDAIFWLNFCLLDLLYFCLWALTTGPPLMPVFVTLMGLSCINIIIIIITIIIYGNLRRCCIFLALFEPNSLTALLYLCSYNCRSSQSLLVSLPFFLSFISSFLCCETFLTYLGRRAQNDKIAHIYSYPNAISPCHYFMF